MTEEYSILLKSRDGESKSKKKKRETEKINTHRVVFRCITSRRRKKKEEEIFDCNQQKKREKNSFTPFCL
jgi:hypothetical protein